jgi:hypothetical protein
LGAESAVREQSPAPAAPATAPAQTVPNHITTQPKIKFAPETVKADTPVITVKGLCPAAKSATSKATAGKTGAACKTVVTREEFEHLISLLGPNLPAAQARVFATRYAQTLVMAAEAKKRGFDKEPEVAELMRYAQMQILEHELTASMQKNSARLADRDAETYYKENQQRFEKADLLRLYIPRQRAGEAATGGEKTDSAQPPIDAKGIAEALQKRAAAGEDFDKLQKEAMDLTQTKAAAPPTKLSKMAKEGLPPTQRTVWDLKPGEVSGVLEEPTAYFVYKMVSREAPPFEQVKDEIRNALKAHTLQQWSDGVLKDKPAELNEQYFPPPGPSRPEMRGHN